MAEEDRFIRYLTDFGLSRQEALVYRELLSGGKQSGYEIAKAAGISRSNAYTSLAALVEKGAAYLVEESAKRYIPVRLEEFCGNRLRRMEEEMAWLSANLPSETESEDGYITVEGEENIRNKMLNLLERAEERVYLSGSTSCLEEVRPQLEALLSAGKKVVLVTDGGKGSFKLPGAVIYVSGPKEKQIGLITDSKYVLSGEYGQGSMNTCLYSGQRNFVTVFKNALANEIELIKIRKGEKAKDE
ncbi:MAG TPA: TrmB family transcriptional regulator [Candidatus Mediterraneibacter intestinavium]|nr:TrmB family transcriptional regulator [Candidatus Mediterraneibacter intestinavium]